MFSFDKLHLVDLFDWGCTNMHLFSETHNQNVFLLVRYKNWEVATDLSLHLISTAKLHTTCTVLCSYSANCNVLNILVPYHKHYIL